MNGQYSIKGYLYQSLVALLDSFETNWETICVEPNNESEKVDIRWSYSNGEIIVVQVKSSKNIFSLSSIKRWAEELTTSTPNANEYKLVLIGNVANNIENRFGNVIIENKNMSIDDFQSIIMQKINSFFEDNGKPQISTKLCKLFVRALNHTILENSIIGRAVYREEFKNSLLDGFGAIEEQLKKSPYTLILPDNQVNNEDIKTTIINNIFKLFGWKNMTKDEGQSVYDEKLGEEIHYSLDYWADYESPLKDKSRDILYINTNLNIDCPQNLSLDIKRSLFSFDLIREKLIKEHRINSDESCEYNINFLISLTDNEKREVCSSSVDLFKGSLLDKNVIYYLVDNKRLEFLISSIITAKSYRASLPVKFLYPITEDNSDMQRIGKREEYMPPQFLNSSILPIIKEDKNKISVLLFCSDDFSKNHLKKIIWLLLRLTSGLANEYIVYFPNYDPSQQNIVNEVIRSYNNNNLNLKVEKISHISADDLKLVPSDCNEVFVDETYNECKNRNLKIQPHLIEFLPYGDSMRPFLASDAVKAIDLKAFLSNKGIYIKSADKTKIIQLMTSMLFSSMDIDSLVDFVNISERPLSTITKHYPLLKENKPINIIKETVASIQVHVLQNNLKAEVVSYDVIDEKNGSIVVKAYIEQTNPNKQALVSVSRSTSKITININKETQKLEFIKESNSRPARIFSDRFVNELSKELIKKNVIEDKAYEIRFSSFSNIERANFLLSFTDIESLNIFTDFDAKTFKYMFDERAELPKEYEDKKGKECVTQLKGKNLDSINELQNEELKSILLCEELAINYKFKTRGVFGNYYVVINFSDALKNKPVPDGLFNYSSKCYLHRSCKERVRSVQTIEKELKLEFNRFVKEKLKQFDKI